MFKVHVFRDGELIGVNRIEHLPRCGDTVRCGQDQYFIVKEVVWCWDENDAEGTRINIRLESEES